LTLAVIKINSGGKTLIEAAKYPAIRLLTLVSYEGRRQLRSATSRTCVVRRTYSNYGDRCICSCRSEAVEQPSNWTATSWH